MGRHNYRQVVERSATPANMASHLNKNPEGVAYYQRTNQLCRPVGATVVENSFAGVPLHYTPACNYIAPSGLLMCVTFYYAEHRCGAPHFFAPEKLAGNRNVCIFAVVNDVEIIEIMGLLVILGGKIFGNADKYLPLQHLLYI